MKNRLFILLLILAAAPSIGLSQHGRSSANLMQEVNTKPGLLNITEINAGIGLYQVDRDFAKRVLNLTDIIGIGIAKNFTGGIGIGFSLYNGGNLEPLFADLRYFFNLKQSRIYLYGDAGILLGSSKTPGGTKILLNPGFGWQLPMTKALSLNISGGLLTQLMKDKAHDSFAVLKAGITYVFNRKS